MTNEQIEAGSIIYMDPSGQSAPEAMKQGNHFGQANIHFLICEEL